MKHTNEQPTITTLDEELAKAPRSLSADETPTEPITVVDTEAWEGKDPFVEVDALQEATSAQRRIDAAEAAHKAAMDADDRARRTKRIENAVAVGVLAAVAVPVGIVGGNALVNHADNELQQNQQWEEDAEQNGRSEFESGLEDGKVTIEVPVVNEIPSPIQQGELDFQLPTLSSEESEK